MSNFLAFNKHRTSSNLVPSVYSICSFVTVCPDDNSDDAGGDPYPWLALKLS